MATCPKCGTRYSSTVRICTHDGTVLNNDEAAPDPQIGKMLDGKYRLDAFLSHGGMGAVYKATHVMLDKTIAVKLIKPELVTSAEVVRRFQREARAASNLNHPNIIAVYDLGQTDDGTLYIAMEYIDGPSLKDVIRKTGPMPVARIVTILRQVGSALSLAHSHNIIHRDLKPHNVMLAKGPGGQEVPKLLDFGIAKTFEEGSTQLTQTGFALGTPQYMAPEQAAGKEVTAQSDLYSLGVMLYEMLTGEVPFDAPTTAAILIKQLTETPEPPSRRKPGVSPALEAVAMQCLDKEPQRRFADADAFIEALNRAGAGEAPITDAPTRVFSAPTVVAPSPGAAPTVLNAPTNVPTAAAHPPVANATRLSPPPAPPMPAVAPPPVAAPPPVMAAPPVIAAPPVAAAPPPPADTRPTVPTPAAVVASAGTTPSRTSLYITLGAIAVLLVAVVAGAAMQFGLLGSGGGSDSATVTPRVAAPQTSPAAADAPPAAAPVPASPAAAPATAAVEAPPPSAPRAAAPPQSPATVPAAAPRSGGTTPSATAAAATELALEATRQALATAAAAARTNARALPSAPPAGAAPAQAPAASRTPAPAATPAAAPEPPTARAARPENPPTFFRCTGFPAVCNALRASLLESMQKGDIPPARDPGRAAIILTANVEVVQDRVSRDFGTVMNTRTYTVDVTGETKDGDPISMPPPRTFSFDAQYGRERLDENARLIAADTVEKIRAFWKK